MEKLYDKDFYEWTTITAQLIKDRQFDAVDWENLVEEIESLGRSEKRAVKSYLAILLLHLLKWQYQPEHQSRSWKNSINNARDELAELLKENPSLKDDFLVESIPGAYGKARGKASNETTIYLQNFPDVCPYSLEQILNDDFFPGKN